MTGALGLALALSTATMVGDAGASTSKSQLAKQVSNIFSAADKALAKDRLIANPQKSFQATSAELLHIAAQLQKLQYTRQTESVGKNLVSVLKNMSSDTVQAAKAAKTAAAAKGLTAQSQAYKVERNWENVLISNERIEVPLSNALRGDLGLPLLAAGTSTTPSTITVKPSN
jgi:hypothetical protein